MSGVAPCVANNIFRPEIREEFDTVIVSVFWYGYRAFRFPAFAGSPHNVAPSLPIKILPSNKGCPIECFLYFCPMYTMQTCFGAIIVYHFIPTTGSTSAIPE